MPLREKPVQKRIDQHKRQAAEKNAEDMRQPHWQAYRKEMEKLLGSGMKARYADENPYPEFAAKANGDLGDAEKLLGEAMRKQFAALLSTEEKPNPKLDERFEIESESRRVMGRASWGMEVLCRVGGFKESLRALESCLDMEIASRRADPMQVLLKAGLDNGWGDTPDKMKERMEALAKSKMWGESSAWAMAEKANESNKWSMMNRFDGGHWIASMIRAATLRNELAPSIAFLIKNYVLLNESADEPDFHRLGEVAGKQVGYLFVRADKMPESLLEDLGDEFWLGFKGSLGGTSKVGKWVLERLIGRAKTDEDVKKLLCAKVWLGLDKKEIKVFDDAFPGYSSKGAKKAIEDFIEHPSAVSTVFSLRDSLEQPRGSWAKKAFVACGMEDPSEGACYGRALAEKMGKAFESLLAFKEAKELAAEVKQAAMERAERKGGKPEVAKRVKSKSL